VPEAAVLGSLNTNVARAIGPALAGLLIAISDVEAAFVANLVAVVAVLALLAGWRNTPREQSVRVGLRTALRALTSYLGSARDPRRLLGRVAVFVAFGSALWALLAVVTRHQLGLGSAGYGVALGLLGVGAVLGAPLVTAFRARLGATAMVTRFGLGFSVVTGAIALADDPVLVMVLLLPAGASWLCVLSTLLTGMQLVLPHGIRGRGLAAFLTVFLGGQGVGALIWGPVADHLGTRSTLLIAAAGGVVTCLVLARWRLPDGGATAVQPA
jgi:predicted MFS family arabinose efflux permease